MSAKKLGSPSRRCSRCRKMKPLKLFHKKSGGNYDKICLTCVTGERIQLGKGLIERSKKMSSRKL